MCKHKNKEMVGFSFYGDIHFTNYKCVDCNELFTDVDNPSIYSYPPINSYIEGKFINIDDLITLGEKAKLLKK